MLRDILGTLVRHHLDFLILLLLFFRALDLLLRLSLLARPRTLVAHRIDTLSSPDDSAELIFYLTGQIKFN